jgi:hypothetical protein
MEASSRPISLANLSRQKKEPSRKENLPGSIEGCNEAMGNSPGAMIWRHLTATVLIAASR